MLKAAVEAAPGGEAPGVEADLALLRRHGRVLFHVVLSSIEHGHEAGRPLEVDPPGFAPELQAHRATFVTLRRAGALRGCVGTAEASRAMIVDVANNAYRSAFRDRRFPPLTVEERRDLEMSISLLSAAVPMRFRQESDLLAQLRPGIDGLIIAAGKRRALFLPSVWEALPEPRRFLGRLKRKAGMPADRPVPGLTASRFAAASIDRAEVVGSG